MAKTKQTYFNRELSWLEFNQRVLEEARDAENPMLERLKFLAITASNLDEFFMVRVGGLHMAYKAGRRKKDPAGLTPRMQLKEVNARAGQMMSDLHACFCNVVSPALANAGIVHVSAEAMTGEQESYVHALFSEEIYPVITPAAICNDEPFPMLRNLALHLLLRLRKKGDRAKTDRFAVIALDRIGERIVSVPVGQGYGYLLFEEIVKRHAANWFPGYEIQESAVFRLTRNADFSVQEEEAPDLLSGMEDVLEERKTGESIRLEVESSISKKLLQLLVECTGTVLENVYRIDGALNLKDFMPLAFVEGFEELKTEAWPPQASPDVIPNEPMFDQIARNDILLYHPYQTYDPVVRFIEEAAADPDTLAIKMVLYRTSTNSAIISALKRAAENGINVTALVELKARFDEARNINWARNLEQSGVQVIHGVKGFKTHAKICLVVRREPAGIVRYCHYGTGNYNESTARLYGDISYMTCDAGLGADASAFFNALCGYAEPTHFNRISMAPVNMRDTLLELIDFEIERASAGRKAGITAKVNSLVDVTLIDRLLAAAKAGVKVRLNVRGICCLVPNHGIEVTSIVDRYLEHARIFHFHHDGKPQVYIASADWMPRNLDKRLELMVPVFDVTCRERLINMLETHASDNMSSWLLQSDGSYKRLAPKGKDKIRSQEVLYAEACAAVDAARKKRRTRFEPHRSGAKDG